MAARPKPKPTVRLQSEEKPLVPPPPPVLVGHDAEPSARLEIPAPDAVGIALTPSSANEDWTALLRRLDGMGLTTFRFDADPVGVRFTGVLRTAAGARTLDAVGRDRAAAMRAALAKVR